jgi:pimeloyl-ACP methyl ester carboxylesterase
MSSDDLEPLLAHTGGIAPDLAGFGRSGKGGHLDYSLTGLAGNVARLLDVLDVDRIRLLGHGWGAAVAIELAALQPERVERLTLVCPGHREGRLERALRTPVLGELVMGATTRRVLERYVRRGTAAKETLSDAHLAALATYFDQGTQRATLRLLRATAPNHLASRRVATPTAVFQGARDPWTVVVPADTTTTVEDAGHWPWLDRPEVAELIAA